MAIRRMWAWPWPGLWDKTEGLLAASAVVGLQMTYDGQIYVYDRAGLLVCSHNSRSGTHIMRGSPLESMCGFAYV